MHFGITVWLAICVDGCHVVNTMTVIMGNRSPEHCIEVGCGSERALHSSVDILRQLTVPVQQVGPLWLKAKIEQIHEQLLLRTTLPPVRFIQEALTEQVSFKKSDRDYHPHDANVFRWFLKCVDCAEQFVTPYGRGDTEALRSAVAMGWGKAKSNSWPGSCRCPIHNSVC